MSTLYTEDEMTAILTMTDEDLLEYFLFRIAEMDEVCGLKQGPHWITREIKEQHTLPVWPFKSFAAMTAIDEWQHLKPVAESIEFFMYRILNKQIEQGVMIEIMPRKTGAGCLISPQRLLNYLEDMRDSSECMVGD
ncbi:DUF2750 domain-containing protein [Methylomonas sp. AM2-LC]|uniref:DUF2750 domain-containing protein n=1 Tax=Methylomonas sp. AM2-LC TaxID=3153301 RepID=UPI0032668716